jgi:hypothetical protein
MLAFPRVAAVGTTAEIALRPAGDEPVLAPRRAYEVRFFSKVDRTDDTRTDRETDDSGNMRIPAAFRECGEYTVEIRNKGSEDILVSESFYAVGAELAALRPYKGDAHSHTTGSDGRNTTAEMLAGARAIGMDFIAVTDHDNYEPSSKGVQEAATLGAGLLVLRGEESTIRGIGGHVLSLNASRLVGGKLRFTPEADKEYAEIAARLAGRRLMSPLTAESYATAVWTVTKIREAGGIAVIAHPYWEGSKGKYYPPRCVFEQLLSDGLIDGVELVGGSPQTEGNLLAVARYTEEAAKGRRLAIVGGSDAHCTNDLGIKYTIVFAASLSEKEVVRAIMDRKSVACDAQLGETVAIFGPFELVEYAYFLSRVYFPAHDRICSTMAGSDPARVMPELAELNGAFWHK